MSHTCCADAPRACQNRLRAIVEGTFVWRHTGWYWLDCRTPNVPWTLCPWCNGRLAPSAEVIRRMVQGVFSDDTLGEPEE